MKSLSRISLKGLFVLTAVAALGFYYLGDWLRQPDPPDALLMQYLEQNYKTNADCNRLLENICPIKETKRGIYRSHQKRLHSYFRYSSWGGPRRFVFIYNPLFGSWPGRQPVTIVITDSDYMPLDWQEVGGSPMLTYTDFKYSANRFPTLLLVMGHRTGGIGAYSYSLIADRITAQGDVQWVKNLTREQIMQKMIEQSTWAGE